MTLRRARCPSPTDLERAFWTDDADVRAHVDDCPRCVVQWSEIEALRRAGARIEAPPSSPQRREEIRTTLLAMKGVMSSDVEPRRRLLWVPAAAAAALAAAWWLWPTAPPAPDLGSLRADVLAHDGARYLVASAHTDEVLRLVDGTVTLDVVRRRAGERTRVITGDAEIATEAAMVDVTAAADRLVAVRVMRGVVEVRAARQVGQTGPDSEAGVLVSAGETWTAPVAPREPQAAQSVGPVDAGAPDARTEPAAPDAGARRLARRHIQASLPVEPPAVEPVPETPAATAPSPARTAARQAFDDGWRAIRDSDFAAAAIAFERAATIGVDARLEEDARFWHAVALARAGLLAEATRALSAFVDAYPESARAGEASVALGWLLVERGDPALAVRRFRAALEDPSPRIRASAAEGLRATEAGR